MPLIKTTLSDPTKLGSYLNGSDMVRDQAEYEKLEFVPGRPGLLMLDLDNDEQLLRTHRCLAIYQTQLKVTEVLWTRSKGGKGYHLYVYVESSRLYPYDNRPDLPAAESTPSKNLLRGQEEQRCRILLQALLGSDPVRETLGLVLVDADDSCPSLFLEKYPERRPYYVLYETVIEGLEKAWKEAQEPACRNYKPNGWLRRLTDSSLRLLQWATSKLH